MLASAGRSCAFPLHHYAGTILATLTKKRTIRVYFHASGAATFYERAMTAEQRIQQLEDKLVAHMQRAGELETQMGQAHQEL